jgi:hypothetical protein
MHYWYGHHMRQLVRCHIEALRFILSWWWAVAATRKQCDTIGHTYPIGVASSIYSVAAAVSEVIEKMKMQEAPPD